jgi:hypothetical protein
MYWSKKSKGSIFAAMKIFSFILGVYILFISIIPCCAFDDCGNNFRKAEISKQQKQNNHCENCSPFALCCNYVGFTVTTQVFEVYSTPANTTQTFLIFDQSFRSDYSASFWQPPKLG